MKAPVSPLARRLFKDPVASRQLIKACMYRGVKTIVDSKGVQYEVRKEPKMTSQPINRAFVCIGSAGMLTFLGLYIYNGYPWFLTLTVAWAAATAYWAGDIV